MNRLSFDALRLANNLRGPLYVNIHGEVNPCKDWSLNDWYTALAGEVGEAGNFLKKIRRGDYPLEGARESIAKELADTAIYLDILAAKCDIDLGEAIAAKFNEVSEKIGVNVLLPDGVEESGGEFLERVRRTQTLTKELGIIDI